MPYLKVLSFREVGCVVWDVSQRLDTNSSRWGRLHAYILCVQVRRGSHGWPDVLCTGFKSGGYTASLWPSEASYLKYLLSLEDSVEHTGGQEERLPSLQVCSLACFSWGPSSLPFSSFFSMFVEVFIKVFHSSKFCNKFDAPEKQKDMTPCGKTLI